MSHDLEQRIRERAYHLWVADGCRDGEADSHWLAAERDVLADLAAAMPAVTPKPRASRRAASADAAAAPAKARRRA